MLKMRLLAFFKNPIMKKVLAIALALLTLGNVLFLVLPKTKADSQINVVFKAEVMDVTFGGRQIMLPYVSPDQSSANKSKYKNAYCINEGKRLDYCGYTKETDLFGSGVAGKYFKKKDEAVWLLENMYISNASNSKDVLKYLADIVTSPDVKKNIKSSVSTDGITSDSIIALNKNVGRGTTNGDNERKRNLIEVVEQLVLWNYTYNDSGINVDNLVKSGIAGTGISKSDAATSKYLYYALRYLSKQHKNNTANGTISKVVTLDKSNKKIDTEKKLIGPYYLVASGVKLPMNSNIKSKISAEVVGINGTKKTIKGNDIKTGDDGSFYINYASVGSLANATLNVNGIYSQIKTTGVVITNDETQNIINLNKSISNYNLKDTIKQEYTGKYNVNIVKVDEKGNIVKNNAATFDVSGTITKKDIKTTTIGRAAIVTAREIKDVTKTESYKIVETQAPKNYTKYDGEINLDVKFKNDGKDYVIDQSATKLNATGKNGKVTMKFSNNSTIDIYVPNKKEYNGTYEINLVKVDDKGNVIENNAATFDITGAVTKKDAKTTTVGYLQIVTDRKIENESAKESYKIVETKAPEGFVKYNGDINVDVQFKKDNDKLVLDKDKTKLNATGNNGEVKLNFSDDTTIEIEVPNKPIPEFDLSLRKFITKIDGKEVETSREPKIDAASKTLLDQTGTAAYHHTKKSVTAVIGSEVEYTIRVYNEGQRDGYAKEITDYLPEGLSFVRVADESSKDYTVTSNASSKEVVIKYNGNTAIKADSIGRIIKGDKDNLYQEVKIICKVNNSSSKYITSRAEITNYGFEEDGEWKEAKAIKNVDRDSIQKTIYNALNLNTWYESAKPHATVQDYYPGAQDDDDFETVEVIVGAYNVVIKKVDSQDKNLTLAGAYFNVNNQKMGPTDANGLLDVLKNEKIVSDKDTKTLTIKEVTAPEGYNLYEKEVVLNIKTKSENGNLMLDKDNTKLSSEDENVKLDVNTSTSTITITILDTKKDFDLSLRKFITKVDEKAVTTRIPQVDLTDLKSGKSTTAKYNHPKDPVDVCKDNVVTYTLRVFNEGALDGYASKIMDDVPEGLMFLPENATNKKYNWKMYQQTTDENAKDTITYAGKKYVETVDATKADLIITDYLKDSLLKAYNPETMKELDYKDVEVAFRVVEANTSDRIITNYAQITEHKDSHGNVVKDRDSTPNEWNEGEDDQDIEKIKLKYFDLALRKWVTEAIITENGNTKVVKTGHHAEDDPEDIVKVDLKKSKIDSVKVQFRYSIRVTNEGEIAGYAKEVSDYIPEGLEFVQADNPAWKVADGKVVTEALANRLLQPGESAEVEIVLTWINNANNMGVMTNVAEISKDYNDFGTPDIDSTPNNKVPGEDDIDDAPVMLTVKTGSSTIAYISLVLEVLAIVAIGSVQIKKRVLRKY